MSWHMLARDLESTARVMGQGHFLHYVQRQRTVEVGPKSDLQLWEGEWTFAWCKLYGKSVPDKSLRKCSTEVIKTVITCLKTCPKLVLASPFWFFSHSFPSYFQIHWCIMELMNNLGDITEIKAEDSKGKEFHTILWKEKNKSFKAS